MNSFPKDNQVASSQIVVNHVKEKVKKRGNAEENKESE